MITGIRRAVLVAEGQVELLHRRRCGTGVVRRRSRRSPPSGQRGTAGSPPAAHPSLKPVKWQKQGNTRAMATVSRRWRPGRPASRRSATASLEGIGEGATPRARLTQAPRDGSRWPRPPPGRRPRASRRRSGGATSRWPGSGAGAPRSGAPTTRRQSAEAPRAARAPRIAEPRAGRRSPPPGASAVFEALEGERRAARAAMASTAAQMSLRSESFSR